MTLPTFSWRRFVLLLRRDLYEHRKAHRNTAIAFFLAFAFSVLIAIIASRNSADEVRPSVVSEVSEIFAILIIPLGFLIKLSGIFENMNTKQSRINFLMVPASNFEKYLVRFLQSSLIPWSIILLMLPLADLTMCFLFYALEFFPYECFSDDVLLGFVDALSELLKGVDLSSFIYIHPLYLFSIFLLHTLAMGTTYVVGGTFFRRFPFVLTSASIFALGTIFSLLFGFGSLYLASYFGLREKLLLSESSAPELFIYLIHFAFWFGLLWNVLGIAWSYRAFKRSNVITARTFGL